MGPHGRGGASAKPKDIKKTIKRIINYMGEYKLRLVFVIFLIVITAIAQVSSTYFLKPLINDYILPYVGQENPDLSGFIRLLVIMGVIFTSGTIASFLYTRIMVDISSATLYKIRLDVFNHLQKLPIRYFDNNSNGDIMSRFTNDIDALKELLSQSFIQVLSSAFSLVGIFLAMLFLSPSLTVIVIVMIFIMLNFIKFLGKKSGVYFGKQQRNIGKVNGFIEEMIEGQKVVKVFCHEDKIKKDFDEINEELFQSAKSANTFAGLLMPIMNNLSYVQYAITAICGALLAIYKGLDLGSIASYLQYTRSFYQPLSQVSQQFNSILKAISGAERIFELLDETPECDNGNVTLVNIKFDENNNIIEVPEVTHNWAWKVNTKDDNFEYVQLKGDVRFKDVIFGYNEDKVVLNDISLFAKPGQKIAFVGSTGAGKTTITNLINRFYDINQGIITYDGIDIKDIKKDDLRKSLAVVLQDTHLFSGTIKDNIRYGCLDATDEEVIKSAKLANAHFFIKQLPNGYDTEIYDDGGSLSQGQRQLLAIARAAIANPPVLILDEATSSIDTRTESLIQKGMDKLMYGRTVFVIAHRLSTVRNSNAIMVMENGCIIERGDHQELIDLGQKYYQLYTGMFELS